MVLLLMERAPSGVALPLSGMASSPKPGVIIIVAAINGRVTTKQCFGFLITCALFLWIMELPGANTIGFRSLGKRAKNTPTPIPVLKSDRETKTYSVVLPTQ